MTCEARPFLKWVGGKTYLLPEIKKRIPAAWNPETDLYVEPFVGAGALFWELAPKRAWLNDLNRALITTWVVLRNNDRARELLLGLREIEAAYRSSPEVKYYSIRSEFNTFMQSVANVEGDQLVDRLLRYARASKVAAMTIFLNKTCFNGLWRVNGKGDFNSPWGHNSRACICDTPNLKACQQQLQVLYPKLCIQDFRALPGLDWQGQPLFDWGGALVYCDPPYVPVSKTADFTRYTTDGFTYRDQLDLAVWAARLRDKGAHVILSQANDESLVESYRRLGFTCDLVQAPRRVSSKGTGRGNVGEYIIY